MKNLKGLAAGAAAVAIALAAAPAAAVDIVGSSTVYPFSTVAAERFSQITGAPAPKIEATGSGGGLQLFCAGTGSPDISNASRRIKASEQRLCAGNGVDEIIEVKIGYDGIVVAQSRAAPGGDAMRLSLREVFLALARQVDDGAGNLVDNPNRTWRDVNAALPDVDIRVYGPPPTSGTRDAFVELAMERGCADSSAMLAGLKKTDKKRFKAACHAVREDGVYVESGENDNLIIQKLAAAPDAVGVFGYSFLEENADKVRGVAVEGVEPSFEAIASGEYALSRPLYFYVKKARLGQTAHLEHFLVFFVQEEVMGEDGFLAERGLIPLPFDEYEEVAGAVQGRAAMERL